MERNIAVGSRTPRRRSIVDCRIDDAWYGPATVLAILEYPLRSPFDLAVGHLARVVHAASVREALHHAATADIAVTVLSAGVAALESTEDMRAFVTHPESGELAVITGHSDAIHAGVLLELGALGVRHLVDIGKPYGWHKLRALLSETAIRPAAVIRKSIRECLRGCGQEVIGFFDALVWNAPAFRTVCEFAGHLGVGASTFSSQFHRLGLPSPRRYLSGTRLMYAALLLEDPRVSAARVADWLQYSSPQGFGRHVRNVLGLSLVEFRYRYSGMRYLQRFVSEMVMPYLAPLQAVGPRLRTVKGLRERVERDVRR